MTNERLNLRNLILFAKDDGSLDVNGIARRLGVSQRTIYRIMREPEYTPNLTLKGYIYLHNIYGLKILEDIERFGEVKW